MSIKDFLIASILANVVLAALLGLGAVTVSQRLSALEVAGYNLESSVHAYHRTMASALLDAPIAYRCQLPKTQQFKSDAAWR